MSCQRTHHRRVLRDAFPGDFPQALVSFKEASGMTWDEIAWLLGTTTTTLLRWRRSETRPSAHYLFALRDLADGIGLGRLLPIGRVRSVPAQGPGDGIRAE